VKRRERLKASDVDGDGELAVANLAGRRRVGTGEDDVVPPNEQPEFEKLAPIQGNLASSFYSVSDNPQFPPIRNPQSAIRNPQSAIA
jgi:hypothetical protein